jgi:hypothetical protein
MWKVVGLPDESVYRTTVGRVVKGGQRHFRAVRRSRLAGHRKIDISDILADHS